MRWFGLALLGILIAAVVAVAASRLASQQIGLASQPLSAGDALAPAAKEGPTRYAPAHRRSHRTAPHAPAPPPEQLEPEPQTTEPAPPPAPVEEPPVSGGEGADD
jgi:hypothetical protein